MNTKIEFKSIAGRRHIYEGKENQDFIKVYEDNEIACISVNDGCSGCEYPVNAAEINASVAEKAAKNPVVWTMKESKFFKYIAGEYNRALCESGLPFDELCSTTAFVIINKRTDVFIAFSIGDCGILSYNAELRVTALLKPQNGLQKSHTFFTNCDEFLLKRISQYHKGVLTDNGFSGFVLFSDGAESIVTPPYDTVQQLVCAGILPKKTSEQHMNTLFGHLSDVCSDDISIAVVSNITDKTEQAARATYNGTIIEDETAETSEDENSEAPTETYDKTVTYESPEPVKYEENESLKGTTKVFDKSDNNISNEEYNVETPKATSNHNSDLKSELLTFLEYPRTLNDILNSGLVDENKLLFTLIPLIKAGLITCNDDNRFSA